MDLSLLQTVRLKGGLADAAIAAAATGRDEPDVQAELQALAAAEHVQERKGRYRLTPAGREALDAALADERAGVDADATAALYEAFTPVNATFKQIATDWQLRDGQPNDHSDAAYDAAVMDRLDALHREVVPFLERAAAAVGRLGPYRGRLASALERVKAGDGRFLLNPMVDSYHQVWFELHEDLIGLAGLDRQREAAAGRAE